MLRTVSDLNKFIDTARQFTAPPSMDTLPSADHAQQVNYGVEMAQRAAQQQPVPPMPPMPPMAGGKVVAGQLNGGGVDLTITALMGDITFRKAE